MPVWLSKRDVASLLNMKRTLKTVEEVYRAHGEGNAVVPGKITLDMSKAGADGWMNSMPAFVAPMDAAGIKFAGGFIHNPEKEGLPYVMATILLIDPRTGALKAAMDGYQITIDRTGAAPAVAAKYLKPRVRVVGIVGAGAVGRAAAEAFDQMFDLKEIRIQDISESAANAAQDALRGRLKAPLVVSRTAAACVAGAEVVVTATHAKTPLFSKKDIVPGCVLFPMGSFTELDPEVVLGAGARIVDHLEQNMHRGEFMPYFRDGKLAESDIYAEIGEIVAGKKAVPNTGEKPVVASLIGVGSLDIALAMQIHGEAEARGLGVRFEQ